MTITSSSILVWGFSLLILFRSLLRGHLVINHVTVLLEGVEVADMWHVVEEAVALQARALLELELTLVVQVVQVLHLH